MKFTVFCVLFAFFSTFPAHGTIATKDSLPTVTAVSPSLLDFNVALSLNNLQSFVRKKATENSGGEVVKNVSESGVHVTVKVEPLPAKTELKADATGKLTLQYPITVTTKVNLDWYANIYATSDGCDKSATYRLNAPLLPTVTQDGRLSFSFGNISVSDDGYKCWVGQRLTAGRDVAAETKAEILSRGKHALGKWMGGLNDLIPSNTVLIEALRRPADFGAVSLGIEQIHIKWRNARKQGSNYMLYGVVEGIPWLRFGDVPAPSKLSTQSNQAAEGFRLPARLLFPTDIALLPKASLQKVSSCLGSFQLAPVPDRADLSVLQHCKAKPAKNIIWLSGDRTPPIENALAFDRPISSFLDQVVTWLDDPELWREVGGIDSLKDEVKSFRKLLTHFQEDTQLPVEKRGTITFSELQINLKSLWLTNEAIVADVMLTGKAKLDLKVNL